MRKIAIAAFFTFLPPLSIILTVPFASLPEHIVHMLFVTFLGMCMGGYILQKDSIQIKKRRINFMPSFTTVIFSLLLLFALTHSMPCPYMFGPQTAQTMIDHPCSQPATPGIATIAFIPIMLMLGTIAITFPVVTSVTPIQTTDPRSPPMS